MSNRTQAAEKLALAAWDFIAQLHNDPEALTDEHRAAIRTHAFRFSRNVPSSDAWPVTYGRRIAGALLAFIDDESPENLRALERASRQFEELRISPPH